MKLIDTLKRLDTATLVAIAEHWHLQVETDGTARDVLIEHLYPRLLSEHYFSDAFDATEYSLRTPLFFIAAHGGILSEEELTKRCFDGDVENALAFVHKMSCCGFLFKDPLLPDYVYILNTHLEYLELPPHFTSYLGRMLANLTETELRYLSAHLNESEKPRQTRHELIVSLRNHLLNPVFLKRHIRELVSYESTLFWELFHNNGHRLYRELLEMDGTHTYDPDNGERLQTLLKTAGLMFTVRKGANCFSDLIVIPRDLYYIIQNEFQPDTRTMLELDALSAGAVITQSLSEIQENSQTLLRDLNVLVAGLGNIAGQSAKDGSGGGKTTAVHPVLSGGKPPYYAEFLLHYNLKRKFVVERYGHYTPSAEFLEILHNPQALYLDLANWWIVTQLWNESTTGPAAVRHPYFTGEISIIRRTILKALRNIAPKSWFKVNDFIKVMMPNLISETAERPVQFLPQEMSDIAFKIVTESLQWLGILAVGKSRFRAMSHHLDVSDDDIDKHTISDRHQSDDNMVFQVTPLGEAMLKSISPNAGKFGDDALSGHSWFLHRADWIIVQGNYEIIAPPDLRLEYVWKLCTFATPMSIDVMSIFKLTIVGVQNALSKNMRPSQVLAFCKEHSRSGIPETVMTLLTQYDKKLSTDTVHLASAQAYLTVTNRSTFHEIINHPRISPMIATTSGDTHVVFMPQYPVDKIERELRMADIVPTVQEQHSGDSASGAEMYRFSVSREDMSKILAVLRFAQWENEKIQIGISDDFAEIAQALIGQFSYTRYFDEQVRNRSLIYEEKTRIAFEQQLNILTADLRSKVEHFASKTMTPRSGVSQRVRYYGVNPAMESQDIRALLLFAITNELEVQVLYIKKNRSEANLSLTPKTLEGNRLLAYCSEIEMESIYSVDRVLSAKLLQDGE